MKDYILPLSTYSDIKKMNYDEKAKWSADLFAKGVKAGKASVTSEEAFVASLAAVLKSTYDIGDLRAKAIIEQFAKILSVAATSKEKPE